MEPQELVLDDVDLRGGAEMAGDRLTDGAQVHARIGVGEHGDGAEELRVPTPLAGFGDVRERPQSPDDDSIVVVDRRCDAAQDGLASTTQGDLVLEPLRRSGVDVLEGLSPARRVDDERRDLCPQVLDAEPHHLVGIDSEDLSEAAVAGETLVLQVREKDAVLDRCQNGAKHRLGSGSRL